MQLKTLVLQKPLIVQLTTFAILLTIAIVAPLFHFQPITGPIVNATLFLGTLLLPIEYALMLCLLPSLVALSVGALPAVLAPMIPFIMVSNTILVVVFSEGVQLLRSHSPKELNSLHSLRLFLAVIFASVLKFLFLFSTSYIIIHLIAQQPIAQKAAQMMSWPQLITALLGGAIAYLTIKVLKKTY